MPLPVGSHAVALNHEHGRALDGDGVPDMNAVAVQGDGDAADLRAQFGKAARRSLNQSVDILFREAGPGKAFPDDADTQPLRIAGEGFRVLLNLDVFLAWV